MTVVVALVVVHLWQDESNVDNMLEESNPTFSFIAYLITLGEDSLASPHASFEFVGHYEDSVDYGGSEGRGEAAATTRLDGMTHEALLAQLVGLVAGMRMHGISDAYFALHGNDEFSSTLDSSMHYAGLADLGEQGTVAGGSEISVPIVIGAEGSKFGIKGTIAQVGGKGLKAVYRIRSEGIAPDGNGAREGTKNGLMAWGPEGAAIYLTARELDVMPWEKDDILLEQSRHLGLLALVNLAKHATGEAAHRRLVKAGTVELLVSLMLRQPPLDVQRLSCVAHALFAITKVANRLLSRGYTCALARPQLDAIRSAIRMLLAIDTQNRQQRTRWKGSRAAPDGSVRADDDERESFEGIQNDAASALVYLNNIDDELAEADALSTPPFGPPSRETSGLAGSAGSGSGSGRSTYGAHGDRFDVSDAPLVVGRSPSKEFSGLARAVGGHSGGFWGSNNSLGCGPNEEGGGHGGPSDSCNSRNSDSLSFGSGTVPRDGVPRDGRFNDAAEAVTSRIIDSSIKGGSADVQKTQAGARPAPGTTSRQGSASNLYDDDEGGQQQQDAEKTSKGTKWQLGPCLGKGLCVCVCDCVDACASVSLSVSISMSMSVSISISICICCLYLCLCLSASVSVSVVCVCI